MIDCLDKAIDLLAMDKNPSAKICGSSAYWIPLQWLYEKMVQNKDLEPIDKIPVEEKIRLWGLVKLIRPEKEKWVLIMICQAIYVYENLEKPQNEIHPTDPNLPGDNSSAVLC